MSGPALALDMQPAMLKADWLTRLNKYSCLNRTAWKKIKEYDPEFHFE